MFEYDGNFLKNLPRLELQLELEPCVKLQL